VNEQEFGFQLTPEAAEGAEQLGTLRIGDLAATVVKTVRGSRGGVARAGRLAREAGRIAAGRSSIEPPRRDWRFADATWQSNPLYRRVMQLYLAPTLIVQGDADPLVATINARWLARRIPHAELHIVPGGGHLMLFDEPERVAPAIDAFPSR
jgi:pimeloyl-ACP methyl ester carboxylesterase